ncbi:P-loop containing nucleoside triphosphate hydrolase protein [Ramaria rubella]|nr:P-loop containing nucleoside triphosphate hydrolase protein [Ramaria rubella]
MGHGRERYNAKARGSTPGKNKKKGKQQVSDVPQSSDPDPNALIFIPKSQEFKENERREKLRRELALASEESKMNSKKKRRLEKYIDKKLKKEDRTILFGKLAQSQALSNSTKLQPSSSLGSGRPTTNEERLFRLEDKETRRALDGLSGSGKRKRRRGDVSTWGATGSDDDASQLEEMMEDDSSNSVAKLYPRFQHVECARPATNIVPSVSAVGSALQRNPDGSVVAPIVVKRKPQITVRKWNKSQVSSSHENMSYSSFDSSDSAYDSSSEASVSFKGNQLGPNENDEEEWTGFSHQPDVSYSDPLQRDQEPIAQQSNSSDSDTSDHPKRKRRRKAEGFKEWALKQIDAAKGHELILNPTPPSSQPSIIPSGAGSNTTSKAHDPIRGPLGEVLSLPSTSFSQHIRSQRPASDETLPLSIKRHVTVNRAEEIQGTRLLLPVVAEEQPIMEAILLNSVVIICGETGSGKTTQIPQFLYEAGFGNAESDNPGIIGITQPRRVAAMSMAARVAAELSLSSSRVSYHIRYDATVSPTTVIKFMTDGVLLRELVTDFLLNRYSVIVVDEAHERSMNTDILIGVLSRVVKLREEMWREGKNGIKPLRLIIMSATLRVSDFTSNATLFRSPPPVIDIAARQHPVTIHFNRRTVPDYVNEAIRKTVKIHARLPPGGILVFLTGQNEITGMCKKLEARFGRAAIRQRKAQRRERGISAVGRREDKGEGEEADGIIPTQVDVEAEDMDLGSHIGNDLAIDVDGDGDTKPNADALDSESEASDGGIIIDADDTNSPMHIVPLYSLLPSDKQMKVFETPPAGARLVVVATNVAETSLTIPDIRYVVDCGRAKERKYDIQSGIQSFQVSWISKASAAQRAGRAGRTGPGHCYRLYSSTLFENHFSDFAQPEILRVPIEGVVLQMKSMNIDAVVNFPFPTSPDRASLKRAETTLGHLGALTGPMGGSRITDLGKMMALFPVSPRFSKMLVSGKQHGCLPFVVAIVSALSVGDPFLREEAVDEPSESESTTLPDTVPELSHIRSHELKRKELAKARRRAFFISQQTHGSLGNGISDVFRVLSVIGAYEYAEGGHAFCTEQFVRPKAMEEIHKLRVQISQIVHANFPDVTKEFTPKLLPPNETQVKWFCSEANALTDDPRQLKILRQLLTAGFIDQVAVRKDLVDKSSASGNKYASSRGVPYKALGVVEDVFIHPSSVLYHVTPPEYVVFHEIVRTTVTVINPNWLSKLGTSLCSISKPIKSSGSNAVVVPRFGPGLWELPPIKQLSS